MDQKGFSFQKQQGYTSKRYLKPPQISVQHDIISVLKFKERRHINRALLHIEKCQIRYFRNDHTRSKAIFTEARELGLPSAERVNLRRLFEITQDSSFSLTPPILLEFNQLDSDNFPIKHFL